MSGRRTNAEWQPKSIKDADLLIVCNDFFIVPNLVFECIPECLNDRQIPAISETIGRFLRRVATKCSTFPLHAHSGITGLCQDGGLRDRQLEWRIH